MKTWKHCNTSTLLYAQTGDLPPVNFFTLFSGIINNLMVATWFTKLYQYITGVWAIDLIIFSTSCSWLMTSRHPQMIGLCRAENKTQMESRPVSMLMKKFSTHVRTSVFFPRTKLVIPCGNPCLQKWLLKLTDIYILYMRYIINFGTYIMPKS